MKTAYTISDLAKYINAKVIGNDQCVISKLAPLHLAKAGELTFLRDDRYRSLLPTTKASAVILTGADSHYCPAVSLIVDHPEVAFATIAHLFDSYEKPLPGVHPTAVVAASAIVADSASIGAHCVIGENVIIGPNTRLTSGVLVNNRVTIGADCLIHNNVTLYHDVSVGHRVILHAGVVVGSDGFGFAQTKTTWKKIPQIGGVEIHDDVEIGANSCVDRGALINTTIQQGVKIDNLVQIAHNVMIGAHTVIAACTVIGGSTQVGAHCMIAGAVQVADHLTICNGVVLTGNAMVTKSIDQPGIYSSGTGLMPNAKWRKMVVRLRQLDEFISKKKQER